MLRCLLGAKHTDPNPSQHPNPLPFRFWGPAFVIRWHITLKCLLLLYKINFCGTHILAQPRQGRAPSSSEEQEPSDNVMPISFTGTFINQPETHPRPKKASNSNKINELACFKVLAESCGLAANVCSGHLWREWTRPRTRTRVWIRGTGLKWNGFVFQILRLLSISYLQGKLKRELIENMAENIPEKLNFSLCMYVV